MNDFNNNFDRPYNHGTLTPEEPRRDWGYDPDEPPVALKERQPELTRSTILTTTAIRKRRNSDAGVAALVAAVLLLGVGGWIFYKSIGVREDDSAPVIEKAPAGTPAASPQDAAIESQLSYGVWTGEIRYNQPHGSGTLKYTSRRLISQFDKEARVAHPGDYIIGEFDTGQLLSGRLYRTNGTTEDIIISSPVE